MSSILQIKNFKFFITQYVFYFVGPPEFTISPPKTIEVYENEVLNFPIQLYGNHQPSYQSKWSHMNISTNHPTMEVRIGIFSAKYISSSLGGSYCGRVLRTKAINKIGKSSYKDTKVFVQCKQPITETMLFWIRFSI